MGIINAIKTVGTICFGYKPKVKNYLPHEFSDTLNYQWLVTLFDEALTHGREMSKANPEKDCFISTTYQVANGEIELVVTYNRMHSDDEIMIQLGADVHVSDRLHLFKRYLNNYVTKHNLDKSFLETFYRNHRLSIFEEVWTCETDSRTYVSKTIADMLESFGVAVPLQPLHREKVSHVEFSDPIV